MNSLMNQSLVSQICHEIGNPLTLINSTIQLMESQNPHIGELEHWNQLREDVRNLTFLFRELSTFNHADSLHIAPTDLYEILYDLLDSFESLAEEKSIRLLFDDTNIFIPAIDYPCDAIKIRQALTNLVKNAIEAADLGSSVNIRLSSCDDESHLLLSIENNGPCLSEQDKKLIFQPFHTTKPNGSGLGLPITAKIMDKHNGRIQVDSAGNRTVFTVYLPITYE